MQVGAVLVLGGLAEDNGNGQGREGTGDAGQLASFSTVPLALFEVLGEPILYRMVENLRRNGAGQIFLVADDALADHAVVKDIARWRIEVMHAPSEDMHSTIEAAIGRCGKLGLRTVVTMRADAYLDLDLADMLQFHRVSKQKASFTCDRLGPLSVAMIDSAYADTACMLVQNRHTLPRAMGDYQHRGYTRRLHTAADLRTLAKDALLGRCTIQPNGSQIRPGVWIAAGARVHPHARIGGRAYVGPYSRLRAGVQVSECAAVERCCDIDRGTVVEDASILPYTYLGVCLDIAHAVVKQNRLLDLTRNLVLDVSDSFMGTSWIGGRATARPPMDPVATSRATPAWRAVGERLRTLLPKRPEPAAPSARISYPKPERPWPALQPVPSTTDSQRS